MRNSFFVKAPPKISEIKKIMLGNDSAVEHYILVLMEKDNNQINCKFVGLSTLKVTNQIMFYRL